MKNSLGKHKQIVFMLIFLCKNFFAGFDPGKEKVLMCGTGKNIAPYVATMSKKIEKLGAYFADYRVIIYENNSHDGTVGLLRAWAEKNPRVMLISEYLTQDELYNRTRYHLSDAAPNRMEMIAYGRNAILDIALSPEFDDFKYLIMTDLDFLQGWKPADVIRSMKADFEWDVITANGVTHNFTYFDRYAYRDTQFPFGPELIGDCFWRMLGLMPLRFTPDQKPFRVYSAFGGLAMYKKDSLMGCRYSGVATAELEQVANTIMQNREKAANKKSFKQKCSHWGKKIKKRFRRHKHRDEEEFNKQCTYPVTFKANTWHDGPVVCEHVTLHASMILKGRDKIYVDPALICQY